jgi:hypothetical protein
MKFSIYDENGAMKPELQVGLAIDDYKLKNKDDFWRKMLAKVPEIELHYELIREKVGEGLTVTQSCAIASIN